jgi:hypothetical protein
MNYILLIIGIILVLMLVFKWAIKLAKFLIVVYLLYLLYVNYDRILNFFQTL